MSRFEKKGVVVSGAAQGIGLEVVRRFTAEGAGVVAFDKNGDALEGVASALGARCVMLVGDVSDRADCRRAVDLCIESFGSIDVMCAHAGIAEPMALPKMTSEHWQRHMDVNVTGIMFCTVEAAKAMIAQGRPGAVVCTSSINAWFVEETHAAYNVTKAAVWAFVRSAAMDLARYGVRVNGVAPGIVDTPLGQIVIADSTLAPRYLDSIPLGRFAQPADVADGVLFLASEDASYITGQTLVIDGGQTLGIRVELGGPSEPPQGDFR